MGCCCFKLPLWVHFFSMHPLGGTVGHYNKIMACNFNDNKMNFTANTLKYSLSWLTNQYWADPCVLFSFWAAPWWNRPITVLIISPTLQMTGPHYLQQPWRLWSYRFSEIQFYGFFGLWMVSDTVEGRQNSYEECAYAADSCQSHVRVILQRGERHGGRGGGGLISLSHLLLLSVSLSAYRALSDFLFSTHSLLRLTWITLVIKLTLDFKRRFPSWESDVLLLIVCHCLPPPPTYHSNAINPCFSTSGRENEFHVLFKHMLTYIHIPVVVSAWIRSD